MTDLPFERDVRRLASAVSGPALAPGDEGYAGECAGANLAVAHRPQVVVGAATEGDVQTAVRFAREHALPMGVLATGHGPSLPVDEGVLITTRRLDRVRVDAGARAAHVGAGALWGPVVHAAAREGLAPLVGSSPSVGVVGYTLGGGLSISMARAHGWAADHVQAMDVVTADGELRRAAPRDEPDLYWALLGGKSNFGVVTTMAFTLFPVTRLYAGNLYYAAEHAGQVLRAYRDFTASAPDEVTSSFALMRMPDAPFLPAFMRGTLTVNVRVSCVAPPAEGARLVAPLRYAAPLLADTVTEMPYADCLGIVPEGGEPWAAVEHFALLDDLTPQAVEAVLDTVGPDAATRIDIVDIRHLGGALAAPPLAPNAVGNRDAGFAVLTLTFTAPGEAALSAASGTELTERIAPRPGDRRHPTFLSHADAVEERTPAAYSPETYRRLRAVKARYDPDNVFRFNHNIPAAG
ncbi:FAD-binding oxidoreductase [Actinacidiphila glaucinigra]|uniref:FAD-binding oxidoreductase n=1 Tax=Actinacidiphila glaucinigra TaxID=235986 RepID=UPI002DD84A48|nr:FAD-binding oxidoreductase [Actinacidiphila glaucinigra]WSD59286.1 FAD-binding oxidoreductase [Actinacidiphila glaucinigra]